MLRKLGCGLMVVFATLGLLTGCGNRVHHHRKINVVASLNFYGGVAQAVLGSHGRVTSLINRAGIDPHSFNPTINDAKQISRADFVVDNGLGYDSWMNSLRRDAPRARSILVGPRIAYQRKGDNPHVWYRPQTMASLAQDLAKQFGRQDPHHRRIFYRNAQRYRHSLMTLRSQLNCLKRHRRQQYVDVSEPVFNYSLAEMGYKVHDSGYAKAVENGADPSPEAIRGVQNDLCHHRIAFFVQNVQDSDVIVKHLVRLAHRHHVPVVKVTETMPNHLSYRDWMTKEYRAVTRVQQTEAREPR